ncbi:MAG: ABC transporter permease, partial [Firmicutes bacterium]|nr:ABC transporter permease [Bacillota bacterium]
RQSDYVLAAKLLGVKPLKIVTSHLIPNTIGLIIVNITFRVPSLIFSEAFLSFLGLGIQSPETSWGALCSAAQTVFTFKPHLMFFPAICIALTMLAFTLMGDGLRDALDPRQRK